MRIPFFINFLPIFIHNWKFRKKLLLPLYRFKQQEMEKRCSDKHGFTEKTIVYMVLPETTFSGGLSDRLRGIISIYAECKAMHLPFKLVFEPLHLEDYLMPNQYDWRIMPNQICWNTSIVYPCTILTYHKDLNNRLQMFAQHTMLRHFLRKKYHQIHIFSNMAIADDQYSELFHELFKPSIELEEQLNYHLSYLGGKGNYISMTFRFRQLLGDFKEGGDILPESERLPYIKKCIHCVERMHKGNPNQKILVTSDSATFLERLNASIYGLSSTLGTPPMGWLYTIPGKVVHLGFTFDASKSTYMKSFVDYFLLSYADTVYQVVDSLLMNSGFPKRAAMLGKRPYKETHL